MSEATSNKKVISNSIIYTATGLLLKCFSFFLLPLYTAYLSTEDYGIRSIAESFMSTMGFVVAFSLFSAVNRFYVDLKNDSEKLKRFYGTVILFTFASSGIWVIVLTAFREYLSKIVFTGIDFYPVICICLISLVFSCEHNIYENILKSQQKALKVSILSISYFVLTVCLNILFIVRMRLGVTGVLLATLISSFSYTVYFLSDMFYHKEITLCFDSNLLKSALKYSIPIMPHNLSTQIALLISKVLIGDTGTLSVLGIYSVATQFGNVADTVQVYVNSAYGPWLYEKLHAKETGYKNDIRKVVKLMISCIGLFFICLSLFAHDFIVLFIDHRYIYAWRYIPLIVGVFSIKTIYYFYVNILFYYKKASRLLFIATLTSSLINVFLSLFMIPKWGAFGSIAADAIAMLFRVMIIVYISEKFDDIGLKIKDFVINFFVVISFIFAGLSLSFLKYSEVFSIYNLVFKIFVVMLYCLFIYFRNKEQIDKLIKKKIS